MRVKGEPNVLYIVIESLTTNNLIGIIVCNRH